MIKVGVLGVGHLGKIHLQCLLNLSNRFSLVTFFDPSTAMAKAAMDITGLMPSHSVDHLLEQVDAVIIASSTATHFELATKCIRSFKHVFIEKPVCVDMQQAKSLLRLAQEAEVVVQIGHVERFNPAFQAAMKEIKSPKMIVCHRLSPVNDRGMDVSVVLDLMIHDIDLILNLTKGGNTSIGGIQKFVVGMGWDTNETDSGQSFDLDASAFMLTASGKVLSESHFVFYNNLKSPEGCVEHTGDNRTGDGDGDDESINVDLANLKFS